jgi:hypothetical protein
LSDITKSLLKSVDNSAQNDLCDKNIKISDLWVFL